MTIGKSIAKEMFPAIILGTRPRLNIPSTQMSLYHSPMHIDFDIAPLAMQLNLYRDVTNFRAYDMINRNIKLSYREEIKDSIKSYEEWDSYGNW